MTTSHFDTVIIGGGIVGMATARELAVRAPGLSVVVLEAENRVAAHQSGNNSGVIHSGLYYKPGSFKARFCVEGREAMYRFCSEHGIAHEQCGKVVVATRDDEIPGLEELERRGRANGLQGLRRLGAEEIREYEPHVRGLAGLLVRETGIADYPGVTRTLAGLLQDADGTVLLGARVFGCHRRSGEIVLETTRGDIACRFLINCAGLQSDRMARLCGLQPGLQITPFRGEYYELVPERATLVRNLIYPVPDPRFPFLGVHFTRMALGGVEAGPNAVLALEREGYSWWRFSLRDVLQMASYRGFWRMVGRYWKTGMAELYRSLSKRAFLRALQTLIPELRLEDIHPAGAGVRAQALLPDGTLADDFRILTAARMVHVLNAPSPAATASLRIGRAIVDMVAAHADCPSSRLSGLRAIPAAG
ncbi:MAG TPA: L-2-hydroxyglutarate oxidase [Gemmataceae bacterium]|nr:L-2-hydroxyglutarate oxidase [Gemmataceae bacterium]